MHTHKKLSYIKNKIIYYSFVFGLTGVFLSSSILAQQYSFDEYLNLPDEKIDIATGALLIEKGILPDLDIDIYLQKISLMTKQLDSLLKNTQHEYDKLTIVNRYFFDNHKYKFQEESNFLTDILNNNHGNCAGFTALYVSITNSLNLPFYAVLAPSHCFVRYSTKNKTVNIETTYNGDIYPDEWYADYLHFDMDSINKKIYFRPISKKEMLAVILNARANVYLARKQYKKVVEDCNKVLEIFPDIAEALVTRGIAYDKLGKPQQAMEDYTNSLKACQNNAVVFSNRGLLYEQIGQFEKAISDYNRALKVNPDFAEVYYNRGIAFARREEHQQAVNDFTKAIQLKPDYADAYFNRACVFNIVGMREEAIADYNKTIELGYETPETYIYRGDCKDATGDKTGACEDWKIGFEMGYKSKNRKKILKYCNE
jgi:tetratricopeptide (TPR) repeat protein